MSIKKLAVLPIFILSLFSTIVAQSEENEKTILSSIVSQLEDINIAGQWFIGYQSSDINNTKSNEFLLKRGYITFEKKFAENFIGRITQDISVDQEGDGEGDVELRLKYGYLRFNSGNFFIFTDSFVEFGLVHRPWIDFEQKVNRYRVQGPMFLDRNDILSSADYGVTATTLFGGKVNNDFQRNINKNYPGKFGSMTLGVYNGGGYHAIERNQNKIFEGRLSLRPFPEIITGLQFTYAKVLGKGNLEISPDFNLDLGAVSYEDEIFSFLISYMKGEGDQSGKLYNSFNKSVQIEGFSIFGEVKIDFLTASLFGRYDFFDYGIVEKRTIAGIAYHFLGENKIIIDYDLNTYDNNSLPDENVLEFAVELRF